MSTRLEEKIKKAKLTKTERIIAEFILNNKNNICFLTATDIAKQTGISDSSVIRLCRTLGYKGYIDLQQDMQKQVLQQMDSRQDALLSPLEKLALPKEYDGNELMQKHLSSSINCIKSCIGTYDQNKFDTIAQIILNSRNKYITGFRGCKSFVSWMALLLGQMTPNVIRNMHGDADALETMLDISQEDCVVLFSFHRYSRMALEVAALTQSAKAKLIVITDRMTAPVANNADEVLVVQTDGVSFFNSQIGTMFAVELLLATVEKLGETPKGRLELLEKHLASTELY